MLEKIKLYQLRIRYAVSLLTASIVSEIYIMCETKSKVISQNACLYTLVWVCVWLWLCLCVCICGRTKKDELYWNFQVAEDKWNNCICLMILNGASQIKSNSINSKFKTINRLIMYNSYQIWLESFASKVHSESWFWFQCNLNCAHSNMAAN